MDIPVDRQWLELQLLTRLLPGYAADPEAALLRESDRHGVGPVALFDPVWYRAHQAVAADEPAILHYMRVGAAEGLDPHPLFSAAYYLRQAPEAAANPLLHFLLRGGHAGLDAHPLFASAWYGDAYPDVREAGMIPLVHYMKWGAAEGRDPNPLFSSRHYRDQTDDPAAAANPLLHYVLGGERAGLSPHPTFRADAVARMFKQAKTKGALHLYLEVIGHAQPTRAALRPSGREEPGIVPPPPTCAPREPGTATLAGKELLRTLQLAAGPQSAYHLHKLDSLRPFPAATADFAFAVAHGAAAEAGVAALVEAAGVLPACLPDPPQGRPEDGILPRYAARLARAGARFRLDPSRAGTAPDGPLISILLPVYRTPIHLLERAILSVLCQTYRHWEVCIVDDGSAQPGLAEALVRFAAADARVKVAALAANAGIAAASNRALELASGPYVGLLDHDDMLAADALEQVAAALAARPDADLVYSDECMIDEDDVPSRLFTKPDWSPMLLTSFMYTGHFSVYRAALVRELGGFRSEFDFSQDYDLALRVAERDPSVVHLREILYGWRTIAQSASAGGKPDARAGNIAALQSALDRRGWGGRAVPLPMSNRVSRTVSPAPLVSLIVPSDDPDHILQTVMSVVAHTAYGRYELVVVARDAVIEACGRALRPGRVRFVPFNAPFNFSAKCNAGAEAARGDYLVFYNDDVRVLTPDWVEALLELLTLPGIGAAAPKLLYEDGTIQHAGMVVGTRRLLTTAFHCFPHASPLHFNLAQSLREVTLLAGACLAMPAAVFAELGGFDAELAPIAHSDVDLCLRLRERGYRCLYTPHAELTHIGHAALGAVERERVFRQDKSDIAMMRRFGPMLEDDPYFPPGMYELLAIGDQRPFRYYAAAAGPRPPARNGDALLISHDLSASGAPKVVYDMARVLLGAGRHVLVMSREDGPFRAKLLALGADVMIEPDVLWAGPAVVDMARNFDVVIGNTVLSWRLLPALAPFTRAFLYSHETGLVDEMAAADPTFAPALGRAAGIWAGSERAAHALHSLGVAASVMEYGVEVPEVHSVEVRGREVVVTLMATIEPRKGQDLAVKAFPLLPPAVRERCTLRLFGRPHDLPFTHAVHELARSDPRVEVGGELNLESYRRALAEADIVLCPSRDDTLPIVSLNALAAGKVLVVSREVGTASYLEDGVSGFVLRQNHPEEIAATIARIVADRARWPEIGEAARRVFRDHFSEARFEARLLAMVGEPLRLGQAAE